MSSKKWNFGQTSDRKFKTHAGDGKPANATDAIFPIVTQQVDGIYVAIGTGFFIAEHGIFVTAAHVVREMLDANDNALGPFGLFQFIDANQFLVRPIISATRHTVADIAVGVAAPMHSKSTNQPLKNKLLTIAKSVPAVGSSVHTYAFPKTEIQPGKPQVISFKPGFYEGSLLQHYPTGRDPIMLPGPCFGTSMVIHGGASGGPVFNEHGQVFAINSTGYNDQALSFVTCITSMLELGIDNMQLPGDNLPRRVSVGELCDRGFIVSA